ncbi:ribonuclease Z [Aerococcus sanguinicola]|uniref:ribonuclease Z n=1 Tax=unclassified Aerococcus TaxID=2618060 RepID=UPI0008A4449B|nr:MULTISPECIES: ribonuclease Z [unclassified Aerococcus]MDK6233603.1 ribonuclease Z [Aerococcus sp. UMB10185]MDK6855714.1 ribonuclease Z [Aerococcus sp. UMB7533]MDK8501467.1 ribonuclease Z [Aerococcus sp. UMB1112A]OFN01361.1 ribonuclease Z [Aerococcus sp. HMSC062A02]OHO46308.1 ribonuclease Z [Aerococcus sp. HMSC035B07]
MELHFLGTGAGVPSRQRNVSALMLKLLDEINEMWLFDCGEATQQQILQTTLKPGKVSRVFITHLHGDHLYGLPGFLSSRSFQGGAERPLTVYGPKGLKQYVWTALKVSQSKLNYPLKIVELEGKGLAFEDSSFKVSYGPLDHAVECFGYRVEQADQEGELLVDKARAAGVPNGPLLGKLKQREKVTLEDGRVLDGNDFVGDKQAGKTVTIFGDTRPCDQALSLAKDADVLVHEATYEAGEEKMAHRHFHSTAAQAAKLAKEAGVKQLYLTHISSRYVTAPQIKQLVQGAQKIHPQSLVVKDFDQFQIK